MKKAIVVLFCLFVLSTSLFAEAFLTSSFGLSYQFLEDTVTYDGDSYTSSTKGKHLSIALDSSFFGEGSGLGLNLGLSLLYPLSGSTDGVELDPDFFYVGWCPRIGISNIYEINEDFVMLTSFGYQMMMKFDSGTVEGVTIKTSLFMHGMYAQDAFLYKISSNATFNAGLNLYFPFIGSLKLSATGYGSEKYSVRYSGAFLTPFVGFNIKR